MLLRSDNVQSLSVRDVRLLVEQEALGVVLDLRTDIEVELEGPGPLAAERAVRTERRPLYPDQAGGADRHAIPVTPWSDQGGWSEESPPVRAYMGYLRRRPDSVVGSLRAIARADSAVLVHCAAGKDRTGVVVALALDAAGVDRAMIVRDYVATAERIEAIVARLVSSPTYRPQLEGQHPSELAPVSGTMERFLGLIDEQCGGSAGWLAANGLNNADIERLRRRFASVLPLR